MDNIDEIVRYLIYSAEEIKDIKEKNLRILNNPNKKKDEALASAKQLKL
jgi:hypothetical protein